MEMIFKISLIAVNAVILATTDNTLAKYTGVIAIILLSISLIGAV